jgi:hypothetical protein
MDFVVDERHCQYFSPELFPGGANKFRKPLSNYCLSQPLLPERSNEILSAKFNKFTTLRIANPATHHQTPIIV